MKGLGFRVQGSRSSGRSVLSGVFVPVYRAPLEIGACVVCVCVCVGAAGNNNKTNNPSS